MHALTLNRTEKLSREPGDVAHGALRGVIASMAMTGMRVVTVSLGLVGQAPPQQIAGETSGRRRAAVEIGHWAFGAGGAAGFAALPSAWRRRSWTGPGYGLLIWSGFEVVAPLLGLPHAEGRKLTERVAVAADHLLYGFVLDEMRRSPRR